jgi:DNA adenine methylase
VANYIPFKVRPVFKYYGGKSYLARRIIELIPDSSIYVEPFAGGLNVLLNKCQCGVEIAGDLNPELIYLYEAVRDHSSVLLDRIKDIPYSEEVYRKACSAGIIEDPIERALNVLIRYQMSFSGMGHSGFSRLKEEMIDGCWGNLSEDLKFTAHRLQGVAFYNEPAMKLINRFDGKNTSFYLDPPYYPLARRSPKKYEHEMTGMEHLLLLRRIQRCQGHVVLSGYDLPTYSNELQGWERYVFDAVSRTSDERSDRVEVVWVKPFEF